MKNAYKIKIENNIYYFISEKSFLDIDEVSTTEERQLMESVADIVINNLVPLENINEYELDKSNIIHSKKQAENFILILEGEVKIGGKEYEAWRTNVNLHKSLIPFEVHLSNKHVGWVIEEDYETALMSLENKKIADKRIAELDLVIKRNKKSDT